MKLTLADQYYSCLSENGNVVPRHELNGETLNLSVGRKYEVYSRDKSKPVLKAVNTQNCPCHLKLIED